MQIGKHGTYGVCSAIEEYVWCKSTPHQESGSQPDRPAVSVLPAEIIKMLALVGYITV